jgi:hypothetical protein
VATADIVSVENEKLQAVSNEINDKRINKYNGLRI